MVECVFYFNTYRSIDELIDLSIVYLIDSFSYVDVDPDPDPEPEV